MLLYWRWPRPVTNTNVPGPNSIRHSVTHQVWHTVEIDMVGPLPKTERGKEYIATCTCLFGKWPEAEALKNKLQLLRQSLFSVWCVEMVACFISFRPGSQVCKCICKAVDKYIGAWRPQIVGIYRWTIYHELTSYIERKLALNYVYGDDLTLSSASLQELTTPLAQVTIPKQTDKM